MCNEVEARYDREVAELDSLPLQELAARVMGDKEAGKRWWNGRAFGLAGVPSEIAGPADGARLVREYLMRANFNIYC